MLCEKCKKEMVRNSRNEALALSAKLGIGGRHVINCAWYPGDSRKILEDWCAENCKPAKPAKPAKSVEPVEEVKKVIVPKIKKINAENKGKNKLDGTSKPSWNYKNKKKD